MKLKNVLIITILLFSSRGFGQGLVFKELPISVGVYGENGIHPGVKMGTFYTFRSKEKYKKHLFKGLQGKYGDKTKLKELSLDYNLGFYSHPNNHTGYFTNIGITYLRTKMRKNRQFGLSLEIGYLRRANKLETYTLNNEGLIERVGGAGNNGLVVGFSPIFAKEFKNNSTRLFFKPTLQVQSLNHTWVPNAVMELGLVFNIHRKK